MAIPAANALSGNESNCTVACTAGSFVSSSMTRPATVMFLVCEKAESAVVNNNTVPMITFFMRLFFMKQNVCFYTVSFDKLSMEKFNEV